jgi:hypothetical protein
VIHIDKLLLRDCTNLYFHHLRDSAYICTLTYCLVLYLSIGHCVCVCVYVCILYVYLDMYIYITIFACYTKMNLSPILILVYIPENSKP